MNNIYNSLYEKESNSHDMKSERVFIYWIFHTCLDWSNSSNPFPPSQHVSFLCFSVFVLIFFYEIC